MKEVPAAEARKHMAELVNRVAYAKERFVLTRHGKGVVAMVPLEELTLLERLRDLLDKHDVEAALAEIDRSGTVSWDEVRRDLDL